MKNPRPCSGLAQKFGYTHEDLAKRLGKSRTTITEALSLNAIPPEVRKVCRLAGITNRSLLLQVVRQGDAQKMLALVEKITSQGATREQLRKDAEKPKAGRPKAFVFAFRPADQSVQPAPAVQQAQRQQGRSDFRARRDSPGAKKQVGSDSLASFKRSSVRAVTLNGWQSMLSRFKLT